MEIFLWLVSLTFILTANAANLPVFPSSIAPHNPSRSTALSTPISETINLAEEWNPDPNINFLATVRNGIEIGSNIYPSSHYPALIAGKWYENLGPKNFSYYPELRLLFQAEGENLTDRFELQVQSQSYPIWGGPEPSDIFPSSYRLWNWTDFNIDMDLPEAWQRVQGAGWQPPLNSFHVEKGGQSGEAWENHDYYVFWGSTEATQYDWVTIDTVTGWISFYPTDEAGSSRVTKNLAVSPQGERISGGTN